MSEEEPWNSKLPGHCDWSFRGLALSGGMALSAATLGQGALQPGQGVSQEGTSRAGSRNSSPDEATPPSNDIDAQTGKILNEAIELLNMENYAAAGEKIGALTLDKLSPYERGTVERSCSTSLMGRSGTKKLVGTSKKPSTRGA